MHVLIENLLHNEQTGYICIFKGGLLTPNNLSSGEWNGKAGCLFILAFTQTPSIENLSEHLGRLLQSGPNS